ncbi:MAG: Wzt carbohydrate-binding domain-containing protein [Acidobacteria bacterium]|nr:Wzt carbohydrate-binding domain-containing protein [Acidobacteriota bacterium]
MAIHFRDASLAPLQQVTVSAPDGAVIGVIGEDASGARQLLRIATGLEPAHSGEVRFDVPARYLGPVDAPQFSSVSTLAIDHTLSNCDALIRARAFTEIDRLRRTGATILIASHDLDMLHQIADEIWWVHDGRLYAKGDSREVTARYLQHIAARHRAWGESVSAPLSPALRRGDGRAEIVSIETLGANAQPTGVLRSGEPMFVRITVRFQSVVDNPVIGMMIRTRIGSEVYGTNTELERYPLGAMQPGQVVRVTYSFPCQLCPQEYTITAASHDPNGVWHDWVEDALAFAVSDSRYTAGVANLRAEVTAERL